jgi:hypothetical protein
MFSPSEPNTETEEEAGILVATVRSQAPKLMCFKGLAESEGFEPPIPFRVCRFSRPVPSTTRPTLQVFGRERHSSASSG